MLGSASKLGPKVKIIIIIIITDNNTIFCMKRDWQQVRL